MEEFSSLDTSITQSDNPFEFKFISHGNIAFTSISLKGVYRSDQIKQNQILSVVDTSSDSDKQSVIFCGDLFNFHLGEQLILEDKKVNHNLENESNSYFSTLQGFKGFPDHQIMFCSSNLDSLKKNIEVSKSVIFENSNLDQNSDFELKFLKEHRHLQPILNISSNKFKRTIELLKLDYKYSPHVIRTLWSLRNQLNIS